jgi:hypothetical protein
MNLASNFVGNISSSQFGGNIGLKPDMDLNDKTFDNILDDKMNVNSTNPVEKIGAPEGFNILDFSGNNDINKINMSEDVNSINDMTTSELLTFIRSPLETIISNHNTHNQLYNFARKHAANFYEKHAGNVVMNSGEFVSDALKLS